MKPSYYVLYSELDNTGKTSKICFMKTKLSSKGQVVIPIEIRKRLDLSTGSIMNCHLDQNRIILSPYESNTEAKLISDAQYVALEAPAGAPEMSPEKVRDILSEL